MTHPSYRTSPGVGDVISQSIALLRRRPGLFFGLGAVAAGITVLASIAMLAIGAAGWSSFTLAAARLDIGRMIELMLTWLGIVLALSGLAGLLGLLVSGMVVRLSRDTLAERRPSLPELFAAVPGFAARVLPLAVAGAVLYAAAVSLIFLPIVPALSTLGVSRPDPEALGGGILLMVLLLLVFGLVLIFFGVRLLYLIQVVALEELGWMAAVRRAWSLTSGSSGAPSAPCWW